MLNRKLLAFRYENRSDEIFGKRVNNSNNCIIYTGDKLDLLCTICLEPCQSSYYENCCHAICESCFDEWNKPCPLCKKNTILILPEKNIIKNAW